MELKDSPVSDKSLGRPTKEEQINEILDVIMKTVVCCGDLHWMKKQVGSCVDKIKVIIKEK